MTINILFTEGLRYYLLKDCDIIYRTIAIIFYRTIKILFTERLKYYLLKD